MNALRIVTNTDKLNGEESASAEADLDSLMDKYDDKEKKDKDAKEMKANKEVKADPNAPTKEMVQDFELKILSGNNMAESSAKTGEDDIINEALDKFTKASKGGNEVIAKDDA